MRVTPRLPAWSCCVVLAFVCSGAAWAGPAAVCRARESALDRLIPCLKAEFGKLGATPVGTCVDSLPLRLVKGRRTLGFGEVDQFGKTSKGTVIEAKTNVVLDAPASGLVLYAGAWRSYGPLVIIDAGCGRDVLVMGPVALDVAGGEAIARGDAIGHVSAPDGGKQPVIYYELRQDGVAIDPGR